MLVRTSHQNENSEISLRPSPSVHPFRPHQNLHDGAFTSPAMAFYSQVSPHLFLHSMVTEISVFVLKPSRFYSYTF